MPFIGIESVSPDDANGDSDNLRFKGGTVNKTIPLQRTWNGIVYIWKNGREQTINLKINTLS